MTQKELIEQLAKRTQTTQTEAKRHLEALSEILTEALQNGERIKLPGLGTFDIRKLAARKGRNPRTGAPLQIAAKNKVRFKAGSELSGKVY